MLENFQSDNVFNNNIQAEPRKTNQSKKNRILINDQ